MVIITASAGFGEGPIPADPFGNFRILDNNGYEYRTNAQGVLLNVTDPGVFPPNVFYSLNYNTRGSVSLSDVVGITFALIEADNFLGFEATALPPQGVFSPFDVDIYDLNEVPFSCRDVIFSCVDENNPLLEEVLAIAGTANVAAFEYGINDVIPHSKGGELLCPGNVISEGVVILRPETYPNTSEFENVIPGTPVFSGYIGLNNGNGRGSMDSFWIYNGCIGSEFCFQNFG